MKTRNKQSVRVFLRGAGFGLIVIFVLAFMIGCGKKDGGSKKATTRTGYNHTEGCVNCKSGTGNFVGAAVGNSMDGGLQLVMDFYLDGSSNQYSGSVVGQGRLHVTGPVQCSSGYSVPSGAFDVVTLTPGYLNNGLISELSLKGGNNSGTTLFIEHARIFEVSPKYTTCDRNAWDYDELSAYIYIDSIGGYSCGAWMYVEMQNAPAVCPY